MRLALPILLLAAAWPARGETPPEHFRARVRPLLEHYCLDCHDGPKPKGDVDLGRFDELAVLWRDPKVWERVLVQLQDHVMPPAKKSQPTEDERQELAGWVRDSLAHPQVELLPRDPGPALPRRLSGLEYNNTLRDLLGVACTPADAFPPDGGGGAGFDNNASTLFLPPLLLERYLAAAETVLAAAKPELLMPVAATDGVDEREAARQNLERLIARAFRRPAPEAVAGYLPIYEKARERGESYDSALRLAAKAVLVSPRFLFRVEEPDPAAKEPTLVDDYDLASRLSFFLWASMPDAELFRLATQHSLHEPAVLAEQTRRLLADPKARAFAENFASQWLRTKEVRTSVAPAPDWYRQFTPELRRALYEEPVRFWHALLVQNRPLTDCLDCRYTFANEDLAKLYGLPGVSGPEMREVALTDPRRGGVLGMGAVLALTSYPRRTSPVLRGKWVMEEILGTPPPPPPADVNTEAVERLQKGITFRQRLEQHRAEPKCAGCHARMDPLGFGLENYGIIGEWRTESEKEAIDASGQLVDGAKFSGPAELKALLLARKDEFARNVTEKLLAYALGRGLEPADWWPVQQIVRATAADGYRSQTLILGITQSYPFLYHRPAKAPAVALAP
jgi:hypothetical protein